MKKVLTFLLSAFIVLPLGGGTSFAADEDVVLEITSNIPEVSANATDIDVVYTIKIIPKTGVEIGAFEFVLSDASGKITLSTTLSDKNSSGYWFDNNLSHLQSFNPNGIFETAFTYMPAEKKFMAAGATTSRNLSAENTFMTIGAKVKADAVGEVTLTAIDFKVADPLGEEITNTSVTPATITVIDETGHIHFYTDEDADEKFIKDRATDCATKNIYWRNCSVEGCDRFDDTGDNYFTGTVCGPHTGDSDTWVYDDIDSANHWHACTASGCVEDGRYDVTEHDYSQTVATDEYKVSDKTCYKYAVYYKSCICGKAGTEMFEYVDGDKLPHTWSTTYEHQNGQHFRTCTVKACGEKEPLADCVSDTISGWENNDTHHWYDCREKCGAELEKAEHSPLQKTEERCIAVESKDCTKPHTYYYTCSVCDLVLKNGDTFKGDESAHAWNEYTWDNDKHTRTCKNCPVKENNSCSGGEATCVAKANCAVCGNEYGSIAPDKHDWGAWQHVDGEEKHKRECEATGCEHIETVECSSDTDLYTVKCTEKAKCSTCGASYGVYGQKHDPADVWTADSAAGHYHVCDNGCETKIGSEPHTLKQIVHDDFIATPGNCTTPNTYYKSCEECRWIDTSAAFSDPNASLGHQWGDWNHVDGTETHKRTCTVEGCGEKDIAQSCSGGTDPVKCTDPKAKCSACGAEYGSTVAHIFSTEYSKDETGHWYKCTNPECTAINDFAQHIPDHEGSATEEYSIKCTECEYLIEAQLQHTHKFDQKNTEVKYRISKATCLKKAVYKLSCKCGEASTNPDDVFEYGELADHTESSHYKWENNQHFKYCTFPGCTHAYDKVGCSGGKATCVAKAKCSVCEHEYGDKAPDDHDLDTTEWLTKSEGHYRKCKNGCGTEGLGLIAHSFDRVVHDDFKVTSGSCITGKPNIYMESCTVCRYKGTEQFEDGSVPAHQWGDWEHVDGTETHDRACKVDGCTARDTAVACSSTETTATCTKKAKCDHCGNEFGELAPHAAKNVEDGKYIAVEGSCVTDTPNMYYQSCAVCFAKLTDKETFAGRVPAHKTTYVQENDEHWEECTVDGCTYKGQKTSCSGGSATCTAKAVCVTCKKTYGNTAIHNYAPEWSFNETHHWHACSNNNPACTSVSDYHEHVPGPEATEDAPQVCLECNYVLAPQLDPSVDENLLMMLIMMMSKKYDVVAEAGEGGYITSAGENKVKFNKSITFSITPAEGYVISAVYVDGKDIGSVAEYTFKNVRADHTITAVFEKAPWVNLFTDVTETAWFYEDVKFVSEAGLMNGNNEAGTLFDPSVIANRSMLITILWRLEGCPVVSNGVKFSDVDASAWYAAAVNWASANGIVEGDGSGTYGPGSPLTREQAAAILYRYAAYKGVIEGTATADSTELEYSTWAKDEVIWAEANGLLKELGIDTSDMTEGISRAEIAAYLRRFCDAILAK